MTNHINIDTDIDKLVDTFIGEWCGTDAAYLIDTDDNPGQRLRENLLALINKQIIEARIDEIEKYNDHCAVDMAKLSGDYNINGSIAALKAKGYGSPYAELRLTQLRTTK